MIDLLKLDNIKSLNQNDLNFLKRCYSTGNEIYQERLKSIGFNNLRNVLDFGSGFGQWSVALSKLNKSIYSIEIDTLRQKIFKEILIKAKINNVLIDQYLSNFSDKKFNGIFSYSVLVQTDYINLLNSFYNILEPGGKLYFTASDTGWYLYKLFENKDESFDSYKFFENAITSSLNYYYDRTFYPGPLNEVIMPQNIVYDLLEEIGFINIKIAGEGKLNFTNGTKPKSFFSSEYKGINSAYEVYCEK